MTDPRELNERIGAALGQMIEDLSENPDDPAALRSATMEIIGACGGNPLAAMAVLARQVALVSQQRDQALDALRAVKAQIRQQPRMAWVLSDEFDFGTNGDTRRMLFAGRVGRDIGAIDCVALLDGDAEHAVASPLSLCFVDGSGAFYLGPATARPPLQSEEYAVHSASATTQFPGIGEVVVRDGPERRVVLYAKCDLAEKIVKRLEEGEAVVVRSEGGVVSRIVEDGDAKALPEWLEFLEPDGPGLSDLVFPKWLRQAWERDLRWIVHQRSLRVMLIGPTGVGKSEAVRRCAREAGKRTGKPVALIRISAPHIVSSYYGETERALKRAIDRATDLAAKNHVVVVLMDEADALLGNSAGRYEGSVDRRVRLAFQELLSDRIEGVAVFLTMNPRSDSWLPSAIERRFRKRFYPRSARGQMAKVGALYASDAALGHLGIGADLFGERVADFVYSDGFVVARVNFHSGRSLDVRARDLHACSPGKLRDLVMDFCTDVEDTEGEVTIDDLFAAVDREFRSAAINEANIFELSFLSRPAHDQVDTVEPVRTSAAGGPPSRAAAG